MSKKIIVVASFRAFYNFCRINKLDINECVFASTEEKLRGLRVREEDIYYVDGCLPVKSLRGIEARLRTITIQKDEKDNNDKRVARIR